MMNMDVNAAVQYCRHMNSVRPKLEILLQFFAALIDNSATVIEIPVA